MIATIWDPAPGLCHWKLTAENCIGLKILKICYHVEIESENEPSMSKLGQFVHKAIKYQPQKIFDKPFFVVTLQTGIGWKVTETI